LYSSSGVSGLFLRKKHLRHGFSAGIAKASVTPLYKESRMWANWNDTLTIYINGDNGTRAEGGPPGTPNEVAFFNGINMSLCAGHRL
jgi:hypothetical protein